MAFKGIDHVVIRVKDIDTAIESYRNLGLKLTRTLETPAIGKQAIFQLPNDTFIELVAPTSPDSAVGRAIEKRGEGRRISYLLPKDADGVRHRRSETAPGNTQVTRGQAAPPWCSAAP